MSILSKLSSVRVRLLTKAISLHIITNDSLSYDKLKKYVTSARIFFTDSDLKAVVNTIHFIVYNATRYDVTSQVLCLELGQLGLPNDLAISLSKIYHAHKEQLQVTLTSQTLKLTSLDAIHWRINYVIASSNSTTQEKEAATAVQTAPVVELRMALDISNTEASFGSQHPSSQIVFDASLENVDLLLHELNEARAIFRKVATASDNQ